MGHLLRQILKFGIVGFTAFIIDFCVMIVLTEVFHLHPVSSSTISFIVSVCFNYFASMRFVFDNRREMDRRKEFTLFVVLSILGLIINDAIMWFGTECAQCDYRLVKLIATLIVMVWNFISRKMLFENRS